MAVAVGPSGENEVYLNQLDRFLEEATTPGTLEKFDDTFVLASMANVLRSQYELFFLFGSGSNQHNQLSLRSDDNVADLVNGEDAHELKEIVVCTKPRHDKDHGPDLAVKVYAGGGHSAILTQSGRLLMFGWNESGQLGSSSTIAVDGVPLPIVSEVDGILVEDAALGFSHTLVIEKETKRLFGFGDNSKGQIDQSIAATTVSSATTPTFLEDTRIIDVAAGLFHSAVITEDGELVTFGSSKAGISPSSGAAYARWKPDVTLTKVSCGRHHTVALDELGRVWTVGDNKYGQLGRPRNEGDSTPGPVNELEGIKVYDIACGWSHTIVLAKDANGETIAYGWGRNDKGQLGNGSILCSPRRLFESHRISSITCGSESTVVLDRDDALWACGWNEHGNLATGNDKDSLQLTKAVGARIVRAPGYPENSVTCIAAGGGHLLAMKVAPRAQ